VLVPDSASLLLAIGEFPDRQLIRQAFAFCFVLGSSLLPENLFHHLPAVE
jgi:hypothetical protein